MVKTDLETDTWFRRKLLSKFQKHTICLVMAHGLFICSDIILLRPTMVVHVAREKERSRIRAPSSFSGPTPRLAPWAEPFCMEAFGRALPGAGVGAAQEVLQTTS